MRNAHQVKAARDEIEEADDREAVVLALLELCRTIDDMAERAASAHAVTAQAIETLAIDLARFTKEKMAAR